MGALMKVKLRRSYYGRTPNQRKNLKALGLRRIDQVKELPDNPSIRGKINKVKHLVEVLQS
jgi:large subunit ribosomal protein L30